MTLTRFFSHLPWTMLLLVLTAGCGRHLAEPAALEAAQNQTATVAVVKPERRTLQRAFEQPGTIEALEETPLFARIPGYVQKVHVDIGDPVKGPKFDDKGKVLQAGTVLAELHVPELEQEHQEKQARVVQAQAEVEQAVAALAAAEAQVLTAKAHVSEAEAARSRVQAAYERWESESKRMEGLLKSKVIDQQTLDEARYQLRASDAARQEVTARIASAEAATSESEARRNKAKADRTAASARVAVAEAEAGRLAALLDYRLIRAPYDGVVIRRNVHTGHLLSGNATKPLFVVARTDTVRVLVDVPESEALLVSDSCKAIVRCQVLKGREFEKTVRRSSWALDPKSRTLRVEIELTNPDKLLRPGMYAYVAFRAEFPNRLALPTAAVVSQADQAFCFVVDKGKAIRTLLQVGHRDAQWVEVLKKRAGESTWVDLSGAEQVISGNLAELKDGQSVRLGTAGK